MEKQRQRVRRDTRSVERSTTDLSTTAAATEISQNPMGPVSAWAQDFGWMGVSAGLTLAAAVLTLAPAVAGPEPWAFLLGLPILLGALAAVAGGVAGALLRAFRGQVSAVAGVLIATCGGNFAASMITISLAEALPAAAAFEGRAGPLALALTLLIPASAVFRARGKPTLPWMLAAGWLAGLAIALGHII